MITYLTRRVLLIIPTVLIVLVLSFILKNLAPGDEVARQLDIEGASTEISYDAYMSAYKKIAARHGYDQPPFYLSIVPSYYPDTLYRIIPKEKRLLITSMLRETKDWPFCHNFLGLLNQAKADLRHDESQKLIYNELLKLDQDKSYSDVVLRMEKIANFYSSPDVPGKSMAQLFDHFNQSKHTSTLVWPMILWNGFNNQFHSWFTNLTTRQNSSLIDGEPSLKKITRALKWTMTMSLITLILVSIIPVIIGVCQVYFQDRLFDRFISLILFALFAVPSFWLATLMVIFFTTPEYGAWTDIFPSIGIKPSFVERSFFSVLGENLSQLVLPIICMTLASLSYITIQLRSDLVNALNTPYVLMARAKGLNKSQILLKHALPNALVPYITILSGAIPFIFTGSVIIEVIFMIPGIGRLMLSSMSLGDWPVVFTIVIVIALATMIGYIIGDVLLMKLYPKTRENFMNSAVGTI